MEIQKGTKNWPIYLIPRVEGVAVTVTQIKTLYSNAFVDNTTTPMSFGLEYTNRQGFKQTLMWSALKSSDSVLYFPVPDSVYAEEEYYSLLFFWKVDNDAVPAVELERIYTIEPIPLLVKNLHSEI